MFNISFTTPIMEAFKLSCLGKLFCCAKNGNQILWNSICSVIYL